MEFFKKFRWFRPTPKQKPPAPESELTKKLKPYEFYLYKIQEIAVWEEPAESILALFLVNVVFWVLSFFQWRFYGLLFSILCLVIAHEAWVEHVWPEIRVPPSPESAKRPEVLPLPLKEGMLSVPEISHYATGLRAAVSGQYARLRLLRQTQPPVYCVVVSAGCLVAAGVGSVFSGATLIYLLAMIALTAPGVVKHLLPPELKKCILQALKSASTIIVPPEVSMDEYYPDATCKENAAVLKQAGDNHESTCSQCHKPHNSLLCDISSNSANIAFDHSPTGPPPDLSPPSTSDSSLGDLMMPGHDESSLDAMDSLLPTIPQESSRESSDSEGALRFRPTHFNGASSMAAHDDSTDEESSLLKDLDFPDVGPTTSGSLKDTVVSTLYRTFPKAFTSQKPVFTRLDDSDSEFEIIETEDAS